MTRAQKDEHDMYSLKMWSLGAKNRITKPSNHSTREARYLKRPKEGCMHFFFWEGQVEKLLLG